MLVSVLREKNGIIESSYLDECIKHFISIRKSILLPYMSRLLSTLEQINPNPSIIAREGGVYLFTIFYKEGKLFRTLFQNDCQALKVMLSELFDVYSVYISRICYSCHDLGILCSALSFIRDDQIICRLPHSVLVSLPEYQPFQSCMESLATNISERLLHISLMLVNNLIANYRPSQADLDYPTIFTTAHVADLPFRLVLYPPVATTLTLLSNLHFSLSHELFTEVASTAVSVCVDSVLEAIPQIHTESELDGKLFGVRNLSILRDQITPFDEVDNSLRKVESVLQDICSDICNIILKLVSPSGVELVRQLSDDKPQNPDKLIEEVQVGMPSAQGMIRKFSVYLHQVHQNELLEILKARLVFFAHKLSVVLSSTDIEERYIQAAQPILSQENL